MPSRRSRQLRILVLSNFYPPLVYGGMELSCQTVVEGLGQRGHIVQVLTSIYGVWKPVRQDNVARLLIPEMDSRRLRNAFGFLWRKRVQSGNRQILRNEIQRFDPDVVFVWGMWNLPRVLAQDVVQAMRGCVLFRFGDYWLVKPPQLQLYWQEPGRTILTRVIKAVLAPLALREMALDPPVNLVIPYSFCVSQALRDELVRKGAPLAQAPTIPSYFVLDPFLKEPIEDRFTRISPCKLLFVGRLKDEKGLHVLIGALESLVRAANSRPWSLTVAGEWEEAYRIQMDALLRDSVVKDRLEFLGPVPAEEIPSLMAQQGIVVIPSLWIEPQGRVAVEAMAAGCVVVASQTGGLPEIIEHERTGFLFPPGAEAALAQILDSLARTPERAQQVALAARAYVRENYTPECSLNRIEEMLYQAADGRGVLESPAYQTTAGVMA